MTASATFEGDQNGYRFEGRRGYLVVRGRGSEHGVDRFQCLVEDRLNHIAHPHGAHRRVHEHDEDEHGGHDEQIGQAHGPCGTVWAPVVVPTRASRVNE